jgi:hypothetical protein
MAIGRIKKGALHRQLGISRGKRIPLKRLFAAKRRAKRTHNTKLARRVQFAINARKFRH